MDIPEKGPMQFLPASHKWVEKLQAPPARGRWTQTKTTDNDTLDLTRDDNELNEVGQTRHTPPDRREDRVMRLKRQLEAGTYRVEGHRIAVYMIDEALENNQVIKHIDSKV